MSTADKLLMERATEAYDRADIVSWFVHEWMESKKKEVDTKREALMAIRHDPLWIGFDSMIKKQVKDALEEEQ
jgi:hypothetical protein